MILLMGIAGSGKGTQGKMLADELGFRLVSMGDLLRMYASKAQRQRMLAGGLLDDQEIILIIDKLLKSLPNDQEVLMDGFPRTISQAEWALGQAQQGRFKLDTAIHLQASKEAVKQRLLKRGRIDDNETAIQKRFLDYEKETKPILEWLIKNGLRLININAERPVAIVHDDIIRQLSN